MMPDSPEDKRPFVIAVANEKGGMGKTTTNTLADELLEYTLNLQTA